MTSAASRIEELRRISPDAARLAEYVSLAVYAEPALLRRMRHELLPGASPAAEADLWFSELVESATPRGIVLRTDVLDALRERIAGKREHRLEARRIVKEIHADAAPIVLVEEKVIAAALDPAVPVAELERLLGRALLTMRDASRADGIAAWAARAIPSLPQRARETAAARTLAAAAALRLRDLSIAVGEPPPDGGLAYLLPAPSIAVKAGVRLLVGALEISVPPLDGAAVVELPEPLFLGIGPAGRPEATRWVALQADRVVAIPLEDVVVRAGTALVRVLATRGTQSVAVDGINDRLAVAGDDGTIELVNLDRAAIATFRLPAPAEVLEFDTVRNELVALGRDGVVRRLRDTGDVRDVLTGALAGPLAVHDGATLATTRSGVLYRDSEGGGVERASRSGVACAALALGDGVIAAAYGDGVVYQWSISGEDQTVQSVGALPTALAYSPHGRLAIVTTTPAIQIWNGDEREASVGLDAQPIGVAWSSEDEVVIALEDGSVRLDATTGRLSMREQSAARGLAVSSDGRLTAFAAAADEVELRTIGGEAFSLIAIAPDAPPEEPPRPATGEHFDTVIVGSGFGGSVMAYRLAEVGQHVCLLERGTAYPPGSFPRTDEGIRGNVWRPQEGRYGMFDFQSLLRADAICASGLGGGSLIYANVLLRKDERWFVREERGSGSWSGGYEYWPVTRADLDPHYDRVEQMLNAQRYPLEWPPYDQTAKTLAFREAAEALGLEWFLVKLAVTFAGEGRPPAVGAPIAERVPNLHGRPRETCRLCGECEIGCNYGAKNTLDYTYLSAAQHLGAELRTLSEVQSLHPREGGGYTVRYVTHKPGGDGEPETATITTDRLVLAAGALGTPSLLLRNRAAFPRLSPTLGTRFSSNGELLNFARDCSTVGPDGQRVPRNLDAAHAPVTTSAIRFPDAADGGYGRGFYLEDGGPPELAARLISAAEPDRGRLAKLGQVALGYLTGRDTGSDTDGSSTLSVLGFGREIPDGVLSLSNGRLRLDYGRGRASAAYFEAVNNASRELATVLGGRLADDPQPHTPLIAHPLGGCPMGRDEGEGVVDAYGRVFNYPGLYIADGSVMPGAVGVNPSMTIAALADRFADAVINEDASVTRRAGSPAH